MIPSRICNQARATTWVAEFRWHSCVTHVARYDPACQCKLYTVCEYVHNPTRRRTGSADLTMWAKLTAIWLKLRHALTWPTTWKRATGSRASRKRLSTCGTGCSLVIHRTTMNSPLAAAYMHSESGASFMPEARSIGQS